MTSTWYTVDESVPDAADRLTAAWLDAPVVNLETCEFILSSARNQVWAFAPESVNDDGEPVAVPGVDEEVPDHLVYAQLKQAENLWNAGRVTAAGDTGGETYSFTPRPLDKTIRTIIRPVRGAFDVG